MSGALPARSSGAIVGTWMAEGQGAIRAWAAFARHARGGPGEPACERCRGPMHALHDPRSAWESARALMCPDGQRLAEEWQAAAAALAEDWRDRRRAAFAAQAATEGPQEGRLL